MIHKATAKQKALAHDEHRKRANDLGFPTVHDALDALAKLQGG